VAQHPDASIADQLVGVVKRRERVAQLRRDLASACAGLAEAERILWKTVRVKVWPQRDTLVHPGLSVKQAEQRIRRGKA
jgi:hypothetical protein